MQSAKLRSALTARGGGPYAGECARPSTKPNTSQLPPSPAPCDSAARSGPPPKVWRCSTRQLPNPRQRFDSAKKLHQKARTGILTPHIASRWCIHAYCNLAWISCLGTSRVVLAVCAPAVHNSGAAAADECSGQGTANKSELTASE